jgi:hypothetical protein
MITEATRVSKEPGPVHSESFTDTHQMTGKTWDCSGR